MHICAAREGVDQELPDGPQQDRSKQHACDSSVSASTTASVKICRTIRSLLAPTAARKPTLAMNAARQQQTRDIDTTK